jgi:hypothetical protein
MRQAVPLALLLLASLCLGCQKDQAVGEYANKGAWDITVRASRHWEVSVPLYLEVSTQDGWRGVSAPFCFCDPDDLATGAAAATFTAERHGNLFLFLDARGSNTVLAMVDTSDHTLYPAIAPYEPSYWGKVEELLARVNRLRGTSDLRLR